MIENKYVSVRIVDRKPRKVIVDTCGNIVNRNPSKEELKCLRQELSKRDIGLIKYKIHVIIDGENFFWVVVNNGKLIKNPTEDGMKNTIWKSYNETNICPRCREEWERDGIELTDKSILYPGNARKCIYFGKDGDKIEEWNCSKHRERYDPNSTNNTRKSVGNRRVENQDPDSNDAKGDRGEELLCQWKGYTSLNRKLNNYNSRIDCLDEKAGEYYQAKVAYYNSGYEWWTYNFRSLQRAIELGFRFKILYLFCIHKDGKSVERIYEIPEKEVINRGGAVIYKSPKHKSGIPIYGWYEWYRMTDKEELKDVNDIWKNKIYSTNKVLGCL